MNAHDLGAQELVVAAFRMAVADATGVSFVHESTGSRKRCFSPHAAEAREFLYSAWAQYLADLADIPLTEIRLRLRRSEPYQVDVAEPRPGAICETQSQTALWPFTVRR
jgi:hypothetical protein